LAAGDTEPHSPFHERLRRIEAELGLNVYGERIQMTASLAGH